MKPLLKSLCQWIRIQSQNQKLTPSMTRFVHRLDEYDQEQSKLPFTERNIYPVDTPAQLVVDCLQELFLGEDWYVVGPMGKDQINTEILCEILYQYNREFREYVDKGDEK